MRRKAFPYGEKNFPSNFRIFRDGLPCRWPLIMVRRRVQGLSISGFTMSTSSQVGDTWVLCVPVYWVHPLRVRPFCWVRPPEVHPYWGPSNWGFASFGSVCPRKCVRQSCYVVNFVGLKIPLSTVPSAHGFVNFTLNRLIGWQIITVVVSLYSWSKF